MAPDFEKANEIYFRLGIIYKQQQKFNQSLEVRSLVSSLDVASFAYRNFSASNTLSATPLVLLQRKISGSRLATSMSNRRT
jgi:hypothetical protein